jgi:NAD(P)-dependent dehydrogenase (short-subunit alcohol dehydrogenase family)
MTCHAPTGNPRLIFNLHKWTTNQNNEWVFSRLQTTFGSSPVIDCRAACASYQEEIARMYHSVFRPGLFAGQVVIITGGGTGIGRCIAHELASLGAVVALGSRKVENCEAVKAEIEAAGGRAFAAACNIREPESVAAFVRAALDAHGRIDGLVNNGGGQFMSPAAQITPKGWHAVVDTNLTGTWNVTQAVFNAWMADHGGAVVSITMENARGYPGMAHSGAARAGVENLTRSLAVEWARCGVRLNAVAPGLIESSGLKQYPEGIQAQMGQFTRAIPAKRMGSEGEIAALVTFLLSPAASFISGQTVWADGAQSLWASPYPIDDHDRWPRAYDGFSAPEDAS